MLVVTFISESGYDPVAGSGFFQRKPMRPAYRVEFRGSSGWDVEEFNVGDRAFRWLGLFKDYANQFVEEGWRHGEFVAEVEGEHLIV